MVAQLALASKLTPARDRCLPVDEVFAPLMPDAGLQRGRVIGCSGVAAWSLALGVISRAVCTGSWVAFVGTPMVGLEAASELGVALERVVLVAVDGSSSVWAERVAAAADGFELIVTCPPVGAERVARRVRQRLQAHSGHPVELIETHVSWVLLSDGVDTSGKVQASDVARLAASHGIRVHTIALGPDDLDSQPQSRDAVDAVALRAMAEAGGGTSFRVRTMDDLEAMAASLDQLEPNPMNRPPLQYWQPLWMWPGGVAMVLAMLLAMRRRA